MTVGLGIGGAEVLLTRLLPQMNSLKYDFSVCSLKKWGITGDRLSEQGIKVVALTGSGKSSFGVLFKLFDLIRKNRYDLIQSHLFFGNFATGIVLAFLKLVHPFTRLPIFIATSHEMGCWQKWFHNFMGRFFYSLADRFVCCSQAVKVSKSELFGTSDDKCEVIYNGISLFPKSSKESKEEICAKVRSELEWTDPSIYLIGSVGRLDNRTKGFNYLIRAISLIVEEMNCRLLIVGAGPDQKSLADLISQLHLSDRIKIIQDGQPAKLLACVDLFVLPSISEGFGIVLLEAMELNKPIVATFTGGIPEVVLNGETGILVWPRNPAALAKAIRFMKSHPDEAIRMAQNGRRRLEENFTLSEMVKKTEVLYEKLLREKTSCAE